MNTSRIGGIDGCPAGWLLAVTATGEGTVETFTFSTFKELVSASQGFAVLAIDIPIGLPDDGPRPPDLAARALLGPRASSVFPAPVRAALNAISYESACELSFAAHGKRLSKQSFAILPKIREVDELLRTRSATDFPVHEVHPEVSFCYLNDGRPMVHPKRTGLGFAERHSLIDAHFPGAFERARMKHRRSEAADDDILDSLAALWTARRIAGRQALSVPTGPLRRDSKDLPMVIWA